MKHLKRTILDPVVLVLFAAFFIYLPLDYAMAFSIGLFAAVAGISFLEGRKNG